MVFWMQWRPRQAVDRGRNSRPLFYNWNSASGHGSINMAIGVRDGPIIVLSRVLVHIPYRVLL
jgi:hypothetical protein